MSNIYLTYGTRGRQKNTRTETANKLILAWQFLAVA